LVNKFVGRWMNHPVRANKVPSEHFIDGAATPPLPRSTQSHHAGWLHNSKELSMWSDPVRTIVYRMGDGNGKCRSFSPWCSASASPSRSLIPGPCAITLVTRNAVSVAMIPLERVPYFARLARCRIQERRRFHGEDEKETSKIGADLACNET